jgi:hypothetical protein
MAYSHQIRAGILPGPDQIAGSLDLPLRHRYRRDLTQAQQPSQVRRIAGIGLDPITARSDQFRRCGHRALNLCLRQRPR